MIALLLSVALATSPTPTPIIPTGVKKDWRVSLKEMCLRKDSGIPKLVAWKKSHCKDVIK